MFFSLSALSGSLAPALIRFRYLGLRYTTHSTKLVKAHIAIRRNDRLPEISKNSYPGITFPNTEPGSARDAECELPASVPHSRCGCAVVKERTTASILSGPFEIEGYLYRRGR